MSGLKDFVDNNGEEKSSITSFMDEALPSGDASQSLSAAQDKNPDQYAESINYGKTYDMPTNVVDSDIEPVKKMDQIKRGEATLAKNKSLDAFLANNIDTAIVAQDDIDPLDQYTKLYGAGGEDIDPSWFDAIGGSIAAGTLSIPAGLGAAYTAIGDTVNQSRADLNEIQPFLGDSFVSAFGGLASLFYEEVAPEVGADTQKYFGEAAAEMAPKFQGTFSENPSFKRGTAAVAQAVPSLGAAIMASAAFGPQSGAYLLAMSEAGPIYTEAKEAGEGTYEAASYSAAAGAINFFLEKYGLEGIMKSPGGKGVKDAVKNFFRGGLPEAGTELLQTISSNIISKLGYDEDRDIFEGGIEAVIGGLFAGGGMSAGMTYIQEKNKADTADANQEFVERLANGDGIDSKTLKRSPELFQTVLQAVVEKDGGLSEVRIPIRELDTYFEGRDKGKEELQAILDSSPALKEQYEEAVAIAADTGVEMDSDLIIPVGVFAAQIAPTHGPALARDIRLGAGGWTANEADTWRKENPDMVEKVRADMQAEQEFTRENQSLLEETTQVFTQQAIESGRFNNDEDAQTSAGMIAKGLINMAVKAGVDPREVIAKYNVQISGVTDEEFIQRRQVPVSKRAELTPEEEEFFAFESDEAIEQRIENDAAAITASEIQRNAAQAEKFVIDGFQKSATLSVNGITGRWYLDAGYSAKEVVAALNKYAEGKDLTAKQGDIISDWKNDLERQKASVEQGPDQTARISALFSAALEIDEAKAMAIGENDALSEDEVIEQLLEITGGVEPEVQEVYFQALEAAQLQEAGDITESIAFKKWSDNGEVVEPEDVNDHDFRDGEPVVLKVFHGTTHKFSVFDANRGNLEGQFGAINYFTSSESDARDNYAGEGPDLTNRIEQRAEQLESDIQDVIDDEGIDAAIEQFIPGVDQFVEDASDIAHAIARNELSGGEDQTLELFVKVENPFVIGEDAAWIELVDDAAINQEALQQVADNNGVEVSEVEENQEQYEEEVDDARWEIAEETPNALVEAIQTVSDRNGVEAQNLYSEVMDLGAEATPETIEQLLRSSEDYLYAEDPETGALINSQLIAEVIEEMGFDSIILKNANERFENMNIEYGTAHVHIFDSNKTNIKSVENVGTFSATDPNIFNQDVDRDKKIAVMLELDKIRTGLLQEEEQERGPIEISPGQQVAEPVGADLQGDNENLERRAAREIFHAAGYGYEAITAGAFADQLIAGIASGKATHPEAVAAMVTALTDISKESPDSYNALLEIAAVLREKGHDIQEKVDKTWTAQFLEAIAQEYRTAEIDGQEFFQSVDGLTDGRTEVVVSGDISPRVEFSQAKNNLWFDVHIDGNFVGRWESTDAAIDDLSSNPNYAPLFGEGAGPQPKLVLDVEDITLTGNETYSTEEDVAGHNAKAEILTLLEDGDILSEDAIFAMRGVDVSKWDDSLIEEFMEAAGDRRTVEEVYEEHLDNVQQDGIEETALDSFDPETDLEAWAILGLGLTEDINEAGYILTDGRLLDLSGKKQGGPAGSRSLDHRQLPIPVKGEISGTDLMIAFQEEAGAIRMDAQSGLIDMEGKPTSKQMDMIEDVFHHSGGLVVSLQDGSRRSEFEVENFEKLPGVINRFYRGQDINIETLFQDKGKEQAPRASINFGEEGITPINLYDNMNLTSLLHETGHLYLRVLRDLAQRAESSPEIKQDWDTIRGWLGVGKTGIMTSAQEEMFADGFLNYLETNKAPSPELQSAFARFKGWLAALAKSFPKIKLTKEVEDVFSRIIASDEEITRAEQQAGYEQVFKSAEEAGWTNAEWIDYTALVGTARQEAEEILMKELMAERKRAQTDVWRNAKKAITAEVTDVINEAPVYNAGSVFRRNKYADGTEVDEDLRNLRMNGDQLTPEQKKALPGLWVKENGTDIDGIAELFGFSSGDEMLNAMIDAPPKAKAISDIVDQRMAAEFGDMMKDDQQLAEEADKAIHSDKRGSLLNTEVKKLANLSNKKPTPVAAIKEAAARIIAGKKVRDLRPDIYQREEAKAARNALKATAEGDFEIAFAEKQKQLMNYHLYRAAKAAKEQTTKDAKKMVKLGKVAAQKRIAKAGGDFLEQINHILERFEFKAVSLKALDKRQSLLEFVSQQEAAGEDIVIDPKLLQEAYAVNYKDMTVEELAGITDTVEHLMHLVSTKNRLLRNADKRDIEEIATELAEQAQKSMKKGKAAPLDPNTLSWWREKVNNRLKALDASLIRVEQIIDWLDGGNPDGPWARLFWNSFPEAQNAENDKVEAQMKVLAESFEKYGSKKDLDRRYTINSLGKQSVTKRWILTVALNVGNDSNYNKLMNGYQWNGQNIEEILSFMTEEDWLFVQSTWNQIEELWPDIVQLEKDVRGLPPEKVVPRPVVTKFGTFSGGYYPVVYDKTKSTAGRRQTVAEEASLFDGATLRATTPRGHLNSRIDNFAAPIKLGFLNVIPNHISNVIHDLTHRVAIRNADKILEQQEVRTAINDTLGPEYVEMLDLWVQSVANDRVLRGKDGLGVWSGFFEKIRINTAVVAMGFKATTMMAQFAGFFNSMDIVPARLLAKHIGIMTANPRKTTDYVFSKSGEMRHRVNNRDRDVKDAMRSITGKTDPISKVKEFAFLGIGYADLYVSIPTWMAAYEDALNQGHTEKAAINAGDRAVRLSQGSGGMKDLPSVMRKNNDMMKLMTMFYSYFSALYSRFRDMGVKVGNEDTYRRTIARMFYLVFLPAVFGEILASRGPDDWDDEEEVAQWLVETVAIYPTATIPMLRDVANYTVPQITGGKSYGYNFSPVTSAIEKMGLAVVSTGKAIGGEEDWDKAAGRVFEASGYLYGLPTGQAKITGGYIYDIATGEAVPEDMGEFVHDLAYRREK